MSTKAGKSIQRLIDVFGKQQDASSLFSFRQGKNCMSSPRMQKDFDKILKNMKLKLQQRKTKEQISGRHLAGMKKR
jgi:hypothetical protein